MLVRLFKPVIVYICAYVNARLNQMEKRIMSELNDAVARLTASVKAELAAVVEKLSQPDPDVAAAITQINSLSDALDAETAQLTPAAPAPEPAPPPADAAAPAADAPAAAAQ